MIARAFVHTNARTIIQTHTQSYSRTRNHTNARATIQTHAQLYKHAGAIIQTRRRNNTNTHAQ